MARRRAPEPDPRIAALHAEPPARFVAARDALARELEAAGDPRAAAVRALRRPTRRVWVLNRVAQDHRAEVETLLAAGARVRAAHAAALRGRGEGLRAADASMSAALDALVEGARAIAATSGRAADHALLVGVREDLRALATAGGAEAERLRAGALERAPAATSGGSGWGIPVRPSPPGRGAGRRRTGDRGRGARTPRHGS